MKELQMWWRRFAFVATLAAMSMLGQSMAGVAHAATGVASSSAAPATLSPTGRMIQRYASANMIGSFTGTQTDAVNLAMVYDVIAVGPSQFNAYLPAMRAANPNLKLLVYLNGTFANPNQGSTFPSSWYLRSSSGKQVTSIVYGNYLMDPTNPGWITNRSQSCAQLVSRYDGCMLDMLGTAPLLPGYLTSQPVDVATGTVYTSSAWLAGTTQLASAVGSAVAPKVVVGNGLSNGVRYFDPAAPTSQIFANIEGAVGETWLKVPSADAAVYPNATNWQKNVDALVDAGNRGRSVVALTKTWGSGTASQISAWHLFALASFLLGTNGTSYYSFSSANTQAGILYDSSLEHANLGQPSGPYTKNANATYQRLFTLGESVVNPTSAATTVTPPRRMCDINGVVQPTVTLGPDGAQVLTDC